jgi:hypothetical protein
MRILGLSLLCTLLIAVAPKLGRADTCSVEIDQRHLTTQRQVVEAIVNSVDCTLDKNKKEIRECHNFSRLLYEKARSLGSLVTFVGVAWINAKKWGTLFDQNGKDTNLSHHVVAVIRVAGDTSDYVVDLTETKPIHRQSIDSFIVERFSKSSFHYVSEENLGRLRTKWWDPSETGGAFR